MALKTFGRLLFNIEKKRWEMYDIPPHVCIKLKNVFPAIAKGSSYPFVFPDKIESCHDLLWFTDRYPMIISAPDLALLYDGRYEHLSIAKALEEILMPGYVPADIVLKDGFNARDYQLKAASFDSVQKRFLLGDDIGLGKTLEAILTLLNKEKRPAIVVVQTHLPKQWKEDGIEKFTNLKAHIIQGTKPYNLPSADVYIIKYSCLSGWVDVFTTGFFKSAIFDEVQELRIEGSNKYSAGRVLSGSVEYCMGMSATPIYNFGDEIFNVLDLVYPGCLGDKWDFLREWAVPHGSHYKVKEPESLGAYLRDNYFFLRRTRKEVGRELPPLNKVVHTVGHDMGEVKRSEEVARQLALKVVGGSFMERGQAARELDAFMRHSTGVAKAREVAAFVRIILESGEPVLLAGWHRDVYGIWEAELWDFNPVFYTGTESPSQKQAAKDAFLSGQTNLFIISLRSGIGLDGLQKRCRTVVIGELDWSPQVHNQVIGRVDRDGNENQVTVYFPVCDFGSDPFIIGLLGLKSSQAHGIIDPLTAVPDQYSDESRIKALAESFLNKKKP
jgi:hypothetical protein